MRKNKKTGFTLVELVVVIMILGILAAVAAPRFLNTAGTANDNGARQTLAVMRDAIELYSAENGGALPGEGGAADLQTDLEPYLRGDFPVCPVGPTANQNSTVQMDTADPLAGNKGQSTGWKYNGTTGEFIINNEDPSVSDTAVNYEDF